VDRKQEVPWIALRVWPVVSPGGALIEILRGRPSRFQAADEIPGARVSAVCGHAGDQTETVGDQDD